MTGKTDQSVVLVHLMNRTLFEYFSQTYFSFVKYKNVSTKLSSNIYTYIFAEIKFKYFVHVLKRVHVYFLNVL